MTTMTRAPHHPTPPGAEPTLADIWHAIEARHAGWHLWRSVAPGNEPTATWATSAHPRHGTGSGVTLHLPSLAMADYAIALYEERGVMDGGLA